MLCARISQPFQINACDGPKINERVASQRLISGLSPESLDSEQEGDKHSERGGRREGALLATDLRNYPVLLLESKCDPIEIIANWKHN